MLSWVLRDFMDSQEFKLDIWIFSAEEEKLTESFGPPEEVYSGSVYFVTDNPVRD